ncbi:hypothetical protein [Paraburkholderia rhynchosiae]|uniref:Uncharacterized protein n=1 Tax=Paraburkholderia rhynchosiae TaxID=487049 RepID=A0A2N7WU06_9BURK|nr:hypothetical protein [Paraburkholderia rhynchosiae]PMS32864.1 hypothetical protein C0Z16_04765 [Paraburkholderia rhynchosiae]CAB3645575.1 hypothetical protein LMG27174_00825 [Paraburkholderia rhynchosiae]
MTKSTSKRLAAQTGTTTAERIVSTEAAIAHALIVGDDTHELRVFLAEQRAALYAEQSASATATASAQEAEQQRIRERASQLDAEFNQRLARINFTKA